MPRAALWLLVALALGLVAGLSLARFPEQAQDVVAVMQVAGTLWVNAIRMTVVPLVVATVLAALLGSGAERLVKAIGARGLALFAAMLLVAVAFALLVAPPLFAALLPDTDARMLSATTTAPTAPPVSLANWLLELIPTNPVKAAAETSMLPLLIFVVLFGLASTRLPAAQRAAIHGGASAISAATLVLVRWVLVLAPIGVFALAVVLGARLGAGAAGAVLVYVGIASALCALVGLALYGFVALATRTRVRDFARASATAQAVAFSARSSLAALPAMVEGAQRLGLRPGVGSFFLPLAASVFRLGPAVVITVAILFLARLYGVPVGAAEMMTIFLAVPLLTFSIPAIPGGSILIMAPVLTSIGIPLEGLGILLATDTFPDMVRTTVSVTADMAAATALDARIPESMETAV